MKCKCGKEVDEDWDYCPYCGSDIEKETMDTEDDDVTILGDNNELTLDDWENSKFY